MRVFPTFLFCLVVLLFVGLLPFDAFAQADKVNWDCTGTGINKIFCGITSQFRFMPKLLSLFAYAIAIALAVQGLLQLRDYGDDPSKVPLQSIIIKFVLAGALVSLPLTMKLFVSTVTGSKSGMPQSSDTIKKPSFGQGVSG